MICVRTHTQIRPVQVRDKKDNGKRRQQVLVEFPEGKSFLFGVDVDDLLYFSLGQFSGRSIRRRTGLDGLRVQLGHGVSEQLLPLSSRGC